VSAPVELSPAEIAAAVSRYQAGEGLEPLARSLGIRARTLRKVLVDEGVAIRPAGMPWVYPRSRAEIALDALALHDAGASMRAISVELGVAYSTIKLLLSEQASPR